MSETNTDTLPKLTYCESRLLQYNITPQFNDTTILKRVFKAREGNNTIYENTEQPAQWFATDAHGDIQILYKNLDNTQLELKGANANVKPFYRTCLNPMHRADHKLMNGTDKKYHQPPETGTNIFLTQTVINNYLHCTGAALPAGVRHTEPVEVVATEPDTAATITDDTDTKPKAKTKKARHTEPVEVANSQLPTGLPTHPETLYLIEGEFKAHCLHMHAILAGTPLAIMGLPGIQQYTNGNKLVRDFAPEIKEYIVQCKITKVVLIHDADSLQMSDWNPAKEPDKDLSKRLWAFHNSVNNMREILKGNEYDTELYYCHIKEDYLTDPVPTIEGATCKGIDDLLLARGDRAPDVIEDLLRESKAKMYFNCFNASTTQPDKLLEYFLLKRKGKVPIDFYLKFQTKIGEHLFNFGGWRYQYVYDEQLAAYHLVTKRHEDANKYIRVGIKYLKVVYKPNSKGIEERVLIPWNKETLKQDYVEKGYKHFLDEIPKYSDFANVPEHNPEKFQLEYKNKAGDIFFNLYYPITHQIIKGEWPTIETYLRHVFIERYTFGLDYLYLSYTRPTQRLPIICLVSKEHNTGKSTLLWLLREIFMQNATVIGNQELHDNFNDDYVSKKFICIDEGVIEKTVVLERLKSWNTSDKIKMNTKNVSRTEIDFFANIVLTSNREDNFIHIDDGADRFFVQKVQPLQKRDPEMLEKMIAEIPAFLYYLNHEHEIVHTRKERFWFASEDYSTQALQNVQIQSKSGLQKSIEIVMEEEFMRHNELAPTHKILTLYLTELEVFTLLTHRYKSNIKIDYLRKVLKDEMRLPQRNFTPLGYSLTTDGNGTLQDITLIKKPRGRYYQFAIEKLIDADTLKELTITTANIESEKLNRANHLRLTPEQLHTELLTQVPNDLPF